MKSGRRRAREFALQGLYQWQLSGNDVAAIKRQLAETRGFDKSDGAYCSALLEGAVREAQRIGQQVQPYLDRPFAELSPVERAILLIAGYELVNQPDVPYKVIINEAVELAKSYGGTGGFKYVNGVLDKLAAQVRPHEIVKGEK
ncbi:MAG TPA: transcription antitermination factor NusB [Burkholderiales bacterium]|nr:transcription antitermination factor NusB [Burkholderiales bacterium]